MIDRTYLVLFLSASNAARSLMAESALNRFGTGRFRAVSAGVAPAAEVHPLTLKVLAERGYDATALRTKHRDQFSDANGPRLDFVISLGEEPDSGPGPVWLSRPMISHWTIADPAGTTGSEEEVITGFRNVYFELERRIRVFANLRVGEIERPVLESILKQLASGASALSRTRAA
jgi:protein-tyrosine-phosphatase